MSGNVLERSASNILILILPVAVAIVVLFTAWPLLLALIIFGIALKTWQQYQWKQWSKQINPLFNELIKENQGCITPLDLSAKANLTGEAAKYFLDKKAEEYGAQRKEFDDKGTVYYFLTASALGSIFDSSEPAVELEEEEEVIEREEAPKVEPTPPVENAPSESGSLSSLIQSELAKRLNVKDYKISRRKSDASFSAWTKKLDPEGISWKYSPKEKLFVPQQT
ncbi:hypothetical protein IQ249_03525 [Lusitaniella coriacea LEGE 07157]|uniref:Uncharacterized protein n=1 Tax=Lusitaniella coriacea LEGE 07157 TaxID=945747 RepID=A0A8J7B3C8_9CYAN|nr:hypothetical protein [Lusitaniella coriacea]MBE9114962.1 hypothetical protein [Lusitaniella coriacea LEGE 07157]